PRPPPDLAQSRRQLVAQCKQMHRVLRRVLQHAGREWPHGPVGALVLLVELHAEEALEQCGEAEGTNAEQLRREPCVEDVAELPTIILVQQTQIVIGIVKHDLHPWILEQLSKLLRSAYRKRIDDRSTVARRELQQVDSI